MSLAGEQDRDEDPKPLATVPIRVTTLIPTKRLYFAGEDFDSGVGTLIGNRCGNIRAPGRLATNQEAGSSSLSGRTTARIINVILCGGG